VEHHVFCPEYSFRDSRVDAIQNLQKRTRKNSIQAAKQSLGWWGQRLQNAHGLAVSLNRLTHRLKKFHRALHARLRRFQVPRRTLQRKSAVIDGQEDGVWRCSIHGGMRRKGILIELPVTAGHNL